MDQGRGVESYKVQLESDLASVMDAYHALGDLQAWSLTLARRRWRVADAETFQGYVHRVELGLGVVHRWMVVMRQTLPAFRIAGVLNTTTPDQKPPKEDSDFAAV